MHLPPLSCLALAALLTAALACGTAVTEQAYYICPTPLPTPTVTTLAGTPTPPLLIPPQPTPYVITAPQPFYVGDAVFVGQPGAPLHLQFRLQHVRVQPAGARRLVTWQLEIRNLGQTTYETVPAALMVITRLGGLHGTSSGLWRTSQAAMRAAGFVGERYDPVLPGTTRLYRLAAYIPAGDAAEFAYLLDGDGGSRIRWHNQANPHCLGSAADERSRADA